MVDGEPQARLCRQADVDHMTAHPPETGDHAAQDGRRRGTLVVTGDNRRPHLSRAPRSMPSLCPLTGAVSQSQIANAAAIVSARPRVNWLRKTPRMPSEVNRSLAEIASPRPSAKRTRRTGVADFAGWRDGRSQRDESLVLAQRTLATGGKEGRLPRKMDRPRDRVPLARADVFLVARVDCHPWLSLL